MQNEPLWRIKLISCTAEGPGCDLQKQSSPMYSIPIIITTEQTPINVLRRAMYLRNTIKNLNYMTWHSRIQYLERKGL